MSKKQMGFTLIEIVMVLVLLGILSAVAVPKYFDLRDQAALKSAQAVVAEAQARVNGKFAAQLLAGDNCSKARTAALTEMTETNFTATGMTGFKIDAPKNEKTQYADVHFTLNGNSYTSAAKVGEAATADLNKVQQLAIPTCGDISASK